jgi:hypothetical protein
MPGRKADSEGKERRRKEIDLKEGEGDPARGRI